MDMMIMILMLMMMMSKINIIYLKTLYYKLMLILFD